MSPSEAPISDAAIELLNQLEYRETALLTWGFLDGSFTEEEVLEIAGEVLAERGLVEEPDELRASLVKHRLLFRLPGKARYRTRYAEAVRLFARLRQMFKADQWDTAPALVADFRLSIRPRRYPTRNIPPDAVEQELKAARPLTPREEQALRALLLPMHAKPLQLARFQVHAAQRLLCPPGDGSAGTLVSAGTGTGKTLAFYLPALITIADQMHATERWTQAIALYPRNELLKDQFAEAHMRARALDPLATAAVGRKIVIGTFYGDTPERATVENVKSVWACKGPGFVCPFLRCPTCGGDLLWKQADLAAGRETLTCGTSTCGGRVGPDEVILTRERLRETPPDLLFTSSEMLNRRMSSLRDRAVFGLGPHRRRAPWAMLLDEAHTYSGVHGAQVALLVRRWRNEVRAPVQLVGLSATLSDPQEFFATLVGLPTSAVQVISAGRELVEEGREYLLALRGDPVSGASLLSTTIQTAMLMGRVLDREDNQPSGGVYSPRVFLFTDDLDVTNRLYHNLLDAEARWSDGNARPEKQPLAALRYPSGNGGLTRFEAGQRWDLCQSIGHSLVPNTAERLKVGRTSSQDRGVDAQSQIIVATAALEVGFDDPNVGAVIQHKAPHDAAAFLQRKGRAGRQRKTRPWTVVVLSDFGRDRLAYQAYEHLFDPVLERPALPVGNRSVLRMQAVYAFMEWLAQRYPAHLPPGSAWDDFTRPTEEGTPWRERQRWAAAEIDRLLLDPAARRPLEDHLARALRIPPPEVQAIMWEPPRALMTAVLPTLQRRLESGWQRVINGVETAGQDTQLKWSPLPEFIPSNLFSDLNLPEVTIVVPQRSGREVAETIEALPVVRALNELPVGRVTRRFAVNRRDVAHWIAPPALTSGEHQIPVTAYTQGEALGTVQAVLSSGESVQELAFFRPGCLTSGFVPTDAVKISSNAFAVWKSQLYSEAPGDTARVPDSTLLAAAVRGVTFFTHNRRSPARVRRFTVGSEAHLLTARGERHVQDIRFIDEEGKPAAVGFEQEVDGIRFDCVIPSEWLWEAHQGEGLRAGRTAFFHCRVENDPTLLRYANRNRFQLEWLGQIFLAILKARALAQRCSLEAAADYYRHAEWDRSVRFAVHVIFQILSLQAPDEEESDEEACGEAATSSRRIREILALFAQPEVRERLLDLAVCLWDTRGPEWDAWLERRARAALGGALLQACYQTAPQFESGDLYLDLDAGPTPPGGELTPADTPSIWITESVIGGGGLVEEVMRRYVEDPRQFFLRVEQALRPTDLEVVDAELKRLVELACTDTGMKAAFADVRAAEGYEELREAKEVLLERLRDSQVLVTHPVMNALNARVLRPGGSAQTDELLRELVALWQEREEELGVEIDIRVFAYLATTVPDIQQRVSTVLEAVSGETDADRQRRYSVVYGMLWPRGSVIRERGLETYHPFHAVPRADPLLLRSALDLETEVIPVNLPDWRTRAEAALCQSGVAHLGAGPAERNLLATLVLALCAEPVDTGFLRLFPYLARYQRQDQRTVATLYLREALQ